MLRIGKEVAEGLSAAHEVGLDPLLVLAMIAVESSFNPEASSSMGAKGLMQIIPRFHLAKLEAYGGEDAVLDPESNIAAGTRILQEYVHRLGSLEAGLQTILVLSGISGADTAERFPYRPTLVIESIADLVGSAADPFKHAG